MATASDNTARLGATRKPLLHQETTDRILACAVPVHTQLGPGLSERAYAIALTLEMRAQGVSFVSEPRLVMKYRDAVVGVHRPDFIVEDKVVVELKAVSRLDPVFESQVLTYLRVSKLRVGLLINFYVSSLNWGIKRIVL